MIIDSFIFNDELEMLSFRLKYLWDVVDKFVIVEADNTFSGKEKSFNFSNGDFKWAMDKIVYFPIRIDTDANPWVVEHRQRRAIIDACHGFSDIDILMLSDIDEIPSTQAVEFRRDNALLYPLTCDQLVIPYKLDFCREDIGWRGTIMCDLGYAREMGTQTLRNMRQQFSPFPQGGWHLTYFGGLEQIVSKVKSYSHQENNKEEFLEGGHISKCIETGSSLFKENAATGMTRVDKSFYPTNFIDKAPEGWWL